MSSSVAGDMVNQREKLKLEFLSSLFVITPKLFGLNGAF